MSEFIYLLENPSFPGVIKIGKTEREGVGRPGASPSDTGGSAEFIVFRQYAVRDAAKTEREIGERLAAHRVPDPAGCFRLAAQEAASILEAMLGPDGDPVEALLFAATEIAIVAGRIEWPGRLAEPLKISYEEAAKLIDELRARGILNGQNELCQDLRAEHERRASAAKRRQEMKASAEIAQKKIHYQMIRQAIQLLAGLVDPETGEPPEVSFENDHGNLVVAVRGSEWVRSEAQRLLASLAEP